MMSWQPEPISPESTAINYMRQELQAVSGLIASISRDEDEPDVFHISMKEIQKTIPSTPIRPLKRLHLHIHKSGNALEIMNVGMPRPSLIEDSDEPSEEKDSPHNGASNIFRLSSLLHLFRHAHTRLSRPPEESLDEKLQLIVLKAAVGMAAESDANVIVFRNVEGHEAERYAMMGAVPVTPGDDLQIAIGSYLKMQSEHFSNFAHSNLTAHDLDQLEAVLDRAKSHPLFAFRTFALTSFDDEEIKDRVFDLMFPTNPGSRSGQDMVLLPGEPSSRPMTEKVLGQIPPFSPTFFYPYQHIAHALAQYSSESWDYQP
jgi:hypothetical protein